MRVCKKANLMKTTIRLAAAIAIVAIASCKKDYNNIVTPATPPTTISSLQAFYDAHKPQPVTFNVDATTGGTFTTTQGTVVMVPANAFQTQSGGPVTGNVSIEFLDLYKKSDMLYCDKSTVLYYGAPLKSAGEFFIKATQNNQAVLMAPGQQIDVQQPLMNAQLDTAMQAFAGQDSTGFGWIPDPNMMLAWNQSNYIFSLYQFSTPADSGSWCNSDNSSYFNAYPQTTLTLHANDDPSEYHTDVFLLFSGINSMVHVYGSFPITDFPYSYAPSGLSCTVVAIGAKDGQLYASFTPITIGNNQTVNFSLSAISETDFQTQLTALN